ncbi:MULTISPECIES: hypothetical protein [unclassified Nocardioides]|uniref:hypothetical protein n=1 Tax=unclassified Nocardioides TaxID=2615069 RepID=UPI001120F22B|nr:MULTISPECIES: hypothetical protein [unclassified Nocardioides]
MTRGRQFFTGLLVALVLTVAISAGLFFGSHAGEAFDDAFWPILGVTAALGVVCGAGASFLVQVGALMAMFFAGGGGS